MQKLAKLVCTLDNCESVVIPEEYIMALEIDNIRESKELKPRVGFKVRRTAEHIYIALHNKGDILTSSDNLHDCNCGCGIGSNCGSSCGCNSLDRDISNYSKLKDYSIVYLELILEGEERGEKIYTDYEEGEGCLNIHQTSIINEFGDLFIVISRSSRVTDKIGEEEANELSYLKHFFFETYKK
jgi:hypothetical protein